MSDKELIKEEIEKQIDYAEDDTRYTESYREGLIAAYQTIKAFIDSIPEEPASEDLEEELHSWMRETCDNNGFFNQLELARHFAEWQKQNMKEALKTEYEKGRFDMREEMMKALIGGEIVKDIHNQLSVESESLNNAFGDIKFGDKVKIIIVKEEQQ